MAGSTFLSTAVLQQIPDGPASLERDVFPRLLDQGVYGQEQRGMFIDIGTPADYARAQELPAVSYVQMGLVPKWRLRLGTE